MPFDRVPGVDENDQLPPDVRGRLAQNLGDTGTPEGEVLARMIEALAGAYRLITDPEFGVIPGTTGSQTAKIKAALDANPGKAFYFPAGSYRLDTSLLATASNTLILHPDARLYAGAAMDVLVDYAPTSQALDKLIVGGQFDGVRLAKTVLRLGNVSRHVLANFTIRNGINKGLHTQKPSGGIFADLIMFVNDSAANSVDNVAMHIEQEDGRFSNIVIRDWTTGVIDAGANWFYRVHAWLSPQQIATRYPDSIGFDMRGPVSVYNEVLSDTMRTPFRVGNSAAGYAANVKMSLCKAYWNPTVLGGTLPITYPSTAIFELVGPLANYVSVRDGMHQATSLAIVPFVVGDTSRFNSFNNGNNSQVSGADHDYVAGVRLGKGTFTPILTGDATAGEATYTKQTGLYTVARESVTYQITVAGTLDSTVNGNLRVRGLPLPPGITTLGVAGVALGYHTGIPFTGAYFVGSAGGNGMSITLAIHDAAGASTPVNGFGERGKTFDIQLTLVVPR